MKWHTRSRDAISTKARRGTQPRPNGSPAVPRAAPPPPLRQERVISPFAPTPRGSVGGPAAWCGLIGLRPTHARVSAAGLTPLAPSFDTVGWLARSTGLTRMVGSVLLGDGGAPVSGLALVRDAAVNGYTDRAVAALLEPLFETCAARGLRIGDVSLVTDLKAAAECVRVLQAHEVWSTHGRWIDSAQPRFGPGVAERFVAARGVTAEQARAAGDEGAPTIGRAGARF